MSTTSNSAPKAWMSPTCEALDLSRTAAKQAAGIDGGGHAAAEGCSGSNCDLS